MNITQEILDDFKEHLKNYIKNTPENKFNFQKMENRKDKVGRDISLLKREEFNPNGNYALFFLLRALLSFSPKEITIKGRRLTHILIENTMTSVKTNFDGNTLMAEAIKNSIEIAVPIYIEHYFKKYFSEYIKFIKDETNDSLDNISDIKANFTTIIKEIFSTTDFKNWMKTYITSLNQVGP